MHVQTGLDRLQAGSFAALAGQRVGLLTNPSAVNHELISAYHLLTSRVVKLTALFAPEHGFAGAMPDAMRIDDTTDPRSGAPIFSLYGDTYRPTPEMLADVDVIVCDIQDVGVRFYTFMWTISHILEVAGEHGVPVIILDRPNPWGGEIIDGPLLETGLSSFVGRFPIPVRHGLTLGELAQMINTRWNPTPAPLTVIPCMGWTRSMTWEQTGLVWIPSSPNMPHIGTVWHYPGACLVEGTQLSEGRGTTLPFEVVGAPWIDPTMLADHLNAQQWPGVRFRPHVFVPAQSKWNGTTCGGIQVHITDRHAWEPLRVWLGVIMAVRHLYPNDFAWLPPFQSSVELSSQHFDRLIGNKMVRAQIDAGASLDDITATWAADRQTFAEQRRPYLLYT
jgi:uncharacterized protein YbbC (DUF1343 family)